MVGDNRLLHTHCLLASPSHIKKNKQKCKIKQNDELSFLIDNIKIIVANYHICIHMSIISDIWVINKDGILHNGHNFFGSFMYRVKQDLESDDMRRDV